VTVRTVRRDVDRLRGLGYAVDAEVGVRGGYSLGWGGAALPPLMLDDDEALALAVALHGLADESTTGVAEAAVRALAKLEQLLPPRVRPRVAALGATSVRLPAPAEPVDGAVMAAVTTACREREVLRIVYRDREGRRSDRLVEPYRVVLAGRRWYVVALSRRRGEPGPGEWRTLRLDRIAEAQPTGHRFRRTDPPDAAAFVAEAITTAPYRHRVRVELAASLAEIAARVPSTVATLEAVDAATTRLTTGGDDLDWLALHVAAIGIPFRVLEPDALRTRLGELAQRLAAAASSTRGEA
jgi:predicted DNA-binding transcriptional regulator YafY